MGMIDNYSYRTMFDTGGYDFIVFETCNDFLGSGACTHIIIIDWNV